MSFSERRFQNWSSFVLQLCLAAVKYPTFLGFFFLDLARTKTRQAKRIARMRGVQICSEFNRFDQMCSDMVRFGQMWSDLTRFVQS